MQQLRLGGSLRGFQFQQARREQWESNEQLRKVIHPSGYSVSPVNEPRSTEPSLLGSSSSRSRVSAGKFVVLHRSWFFLPTFVFFSADYRRDAAAALFPAYGGNGVDLNFLRVHHMGIELPSANPGSPTSPARRATTYEGIKLVRLELPRRDEGKRGEGRGGRVEERARRAAR